MSATENKKEIVKILGELIESNDLKKPLFLFDIFLAKKIAGLKFETHEDLVFFNNIYTDSLRLKATKTALALEKMIQKMDLPTVLAIGTLKNLHPNLNLQVKEKILDIVLRGNKKETAFINLHQGKLPFQIQNSIQQAKEIRLKLLSFLESGNKIQDLEQADKWRAEFIEFRHEMLKKNLPKEIENFYTTVKDKILLPNCQKKIAAIYEKSYQNLIDNSVINKQNPLKNLVKHLNSNDSLEGRMQLLKENIDFKMILSKNLLSAAKYAWTKINLDNTTITEVITCIEKLSHFLSKENQKELMNFIYQDLKNYPLNLKTEKEFNEMSITIRYNPLFSDQQKKELLKDLKIQKTQWIISQTADKNILSKIENIIKTDPDFEKVREKLLTSINNKRIQNPMQNLKQTCKQFISPKANNNLLKIK